MTALEPTARITAKPTVYQQQRFRSALEARWAVFFHAQGIVWNYEPETFALTSGIYIPDFHLRWASGQSLWAEVKPGLWDLDDYDRQRHTEFAGGGRLLLILDGPPEPRPYHVVGRRGGIALRRAGPDPMSLSSELDDGTLRASCRRAATVRFKRR